MIGAHLLAMPTDPERCVKREAQAQVLQEQRFSEYWDANADCVVQSTEFSMIDHILMTKNLYSIATNAFSYHAYPHSCEGNTYNSDHDPVVIDFELF